MNQATDNHLSEYYSYPVYPDPPQDRQTHPDVLARVIKQAEALSGQGLVVVDLDSTIYDNRPREVRILREFGATQNIPILTKCRPEHIQDRSLTRSMTHAGLSQAEAEALDAAARDFWFDRFFTSEYCQEDRPIPGAIEYFAKIQNTKARIFYCTGRPLQMEEGTLLSLSRDRFPIPDGKQVFLWMKPTFYMTDDESKLHFQEKLKSQGTVIAAFDNEPLHINGYHDSFPEALSVHLLTEESGRGISVHSSIPSVKNFIF